MNVIQDKPEKMKTWHLRELLQVQPELKIKLKGKTL